MTGRNTKSSSVVSSDKVSDVGEDNTERYITDMKELPEYKEEDKKEPATPQVRQQSVNKPNVAQAVKNDVEPKEPTSLPDKNSKVQIAKDTSKVAEVNDMVGEPPANQDDDNSDKKRLDDMPFSMKDIILGAINVVTVVLLVILLFRIPQKANEVKSLRNDNVKSQTKVELESAALDKSKKMADQLNSLFLDESGVVNFVSSVDKMKTQGVITDITFASQNATSDKTGNNGIPVAIKMVGNWNQIDPTLSQIQQLPFLERAVQVTATENDQGVLIFNYGILLYVNESLGQTR